MATQPKIKAHRIEMPNLLTKVFDPTKTDEVKNEIAALKLSHTDEINRLNEQHGQELQRTNTEHDLAGYLRALDDVQSAINSLRVAAQTIVLPLVEPAEIRGMLPHVADTELS